MNSARYRRIELPLVACLLVALAQPGLGSDLRIWVDVNGQFSVEARIESVDDETVVLRRKDGHEVTVSIERLSEADKEYLEDYRRRAAAAGNPLRLQAASESEFSPLPVLDLPQADRELADVRSLQRLPAASVPIAESLPDPLPADPPPATVTVGEAQIRIYDVDVYDDCSRPIPVSMISASGTRSTSIAMSISRGLGSRGPSAKNQLVRFDIEQQRAYVSLNHHETIRLWDHYDDSDRSLVLTGFDSRGHGGRIAIASGWGPSGIKLSYLRAISDQVLDTRVRAPELRWARWIDDEHFVAIIDETLGLWNIVSGQQLYQIGDIDHRAVPALSGGRHYLAIPVKQAVVLYETATAKPLGRIPVDKQIPGVSFSPHSDRLAIATSRQVQCWDLTTAAVTAAVKSRTILGSKSPIWVDSDLILSSSGVLLSLFRGVPIWRYDIATAEVGSVGTRVAIFRKKSASELDCLTIPHPAAREAIEWLDSRLPETDPATWHMLGHSQWGDGSWVDRNARISAAESPRR